MEGSKGWEMTVGVGGVPTMRGITPGFEVETGGSGKRETEGEGIISADSSIEEVSWDRGGDGMDEMGDE